MSIKINIFTSISLSIMRVVFQIQRKMQGMCEISGVKFGGIEISSKHTHIASRVKVVSH